VVGDHADEANDETAQGKTNVNIQRIRTSISCDDEKTHKGNIQKYIYQNEFSISWSHDSSDL